MATKKKTTKKSTKADPTTSDKESKKDENVQSKEDTGSSRPAENEGAPQEESNVQAEAVPVPKQEDRAAGSNAELREQW